MASSLFNLVDNLAEKIHKNKCTNFNTFCLEYTKINNDLTEQKSLRCNKNYQKQFDDNLKKGSSNTYKSAEYDINKYIL